MLFLSNEYVEEILEIRLLHFRGLDIVGQGSNRKIIVHGKCHQINV